MAHITFIIIISVFTTINLNEINGRIMSQNVLESFENKNKENTPKMTSRSLKDLKLTLQNYKDIGNTWLGEEEEVDPVIRRTLWIAGLYIRIHKFFNSDPQYKNYKDLPAFLSEVNNPNEPTLTTTFQFPDSPLKQMHHSLQVACEKGLGECLETVADRAEKSEVLGAWNSMQKATDEGMKSSKYVGTDKSINKLPFETYDTEQFKFMTTASYYLCWYTMQRMKSLRYFGSLCLIDKRKPDFRDKDTVPWGCAELSFCPDPCCGKLHPAGNVPKKPTCTNHPTNPCRGVGSGVCSLDPEHNRDLHKMAENMLNYTCDCGSSMEGFKYSTTLKMCVDIDECEENISPCPQGELCHNTVGSYRCVCPLGFLRNSNGRCQQDLTVETDMILQQEKESNAAAILWIEDTLEAKRVKDPNGQFARNQANATDITQSLATFSTVVSFAITWKCLRLELLSS